MAKTLPKRELGKSKFSMYLRTQCDRELYLSLFSNNPTELTASDIPVPLKSRPGVQLITASGREFEYDQYDQLINALPNNVIHKSNGRAKVDLASSLSACNAPVFILQPEIEPETFRDVSLKNLGVAIEDMQFIPKLSGLRPDILYVGPHSTAEYEVLPNGARKRLNPKDTRLPISVIDLKNITEANASYSAEVCLYAFFLANWLHQSAGDLSQKFFISTDVYLWRHVEMPRFTKLLSTAAGGDHAKRIKALLDDLNDGLVNYLIYMPSVRKFFVEDVPRVVRTGDVQGWQSVPYHVNPRCSSCDWLGNESWLSSDHKEIFDKNPEHYCFHNAEVSDHLSKMASLSKGATQVLASGGHEKVVDLVGIEPSASALKRHTLLKKDRMQIGARAEALTNEATSVDTVARIGGLAKWRSAEFNIVVNFDAGSGFLTGIAVRGTLFAPYPHKFPAQNGEAMSIQVLGEADFVVPKDNLEAEWATLLAFIEQFAEWIEHGDKVFKEEHWGKVRTQICFWESRQYEELCNAFGRHLLKILDLPAKSHRLHRALAWLFPSEELMEKDDQISPSIVFIRDIVNASVRLPQRFAVTLLGTAGHYHHPNMTPRNLDKYYVEPLGNAIPRERIFEIWKSPSGTVRMFGKSITIADAIKRYGSVLNAHCWALASITARLHTDLQDCLDGKAPVLDLSIRTGLTGVAYDSKLWDQWASVSAAVDATEGKLSLITRPEWLEASYKAIVLEKLLNDLGSNRYEYSVSQESTEAKIEEGDSFCTLGLADWPGFPLQTGASLNLSVDSSASNSLYIPMHKVIAVTLEEFDRVQCKAIISLRPRSAWVKPVFDALIDEEVLPIGTQSIYLLDGLPYNDSSTTTQILKDIGNPVCAKVAPESLIAMGKSAAKKIPAGTDQDTPIARVLWQAKDLASTAVRTPEQAQNIAEFASTANKNPLNESQRNAVMACATNQLSIVWGPPGTGKTDTLVALLHAVIREGKQRKILITGPNYRTVEEISERLANNLNSDINAICDFYWVYSRWREPKAVPDTKPHLNLHSIRLESGLPETQLLVDSVTDSGRITIVATTAHIVNRIIEAVAGDGCHLIQGIFDFTVLDESSQIPVTLALRPFCSLKENSQVVIAGDHLQMPPIHSLEPPVGAEYLVDSIQTYLIKRFGIKKQELLINYRSNQDLVDYAKSLGYPSGLKALNDKKDLRLRADLVQVAGTVPNSLPSTNAYQELLLPQRRVTALIHEDAISSQANEMEAGLVAGLAYCVRHAMTKELDTGTSSTDETEFTDDEFFKFGIGIVTPHKAQKALVLRELIKLFPDADPEKVFEAVDTVERFQGGERQTIIVSFGVGDTDIIEGEEAFLLQMERTNVAVSRAMSKCIMLMPKSLAYHLPSDQKAAETAVAIKSYIDEFCDKKLPVQIEFQGKSHDAEVRWH